MVAAAGIKRLVTSAPVIVRPHTKYESASDRVDIYHWTRWYTENGDWKWCAHWLTQVHTEQVSQVLSHVVR